MGWISRFAPQLQSILRIVTGLLFLEHGTQKLFQFPPLPPEMAAMHVPDNAKPVLMAAAIIELVSGALVTLGLYSRIAAFIAAGEMAVAYWGVHVMMRHNLFPAFNGGDPAILYCFVFLYLAAAGPGPIAANQK